MEKIKRKRKERKRENKGGTAKPLGFPSLRRAKCEWRKEREKQ